MKTKIIYNLGDFTLEIDDISDTQNLEFLATKAKELVETFQDLGPKPTKKTPPVPMDGNKKEVIVAWVLQNPGHAANHVAEYCGVPRCASKVKELVASKHLVRAESLYYSVSDGKRRVMANGLYAAGSEPTLEGDARILCDWYSALPDPRMGSRTLLQECPLPRDRAQQALIYCIEEKQWFSHETVEAAGKTPAYKAVVVAPLL